MRYFILVILFTGLQHLAQAQPTLKLDEVEAAIRKNHPALQMLEAESKASDAAAEGAYSWMMPELGAGFFMTPYDPGRWKYRNGQPGRGSFMLTVQQMFPNRQQQKSRHDFLAARSALDRQQKEVLVNDLLLTARRSYFESIILEKKLAVLDESEKLLKFMIQSAEIRYQNGLGKISAYYKAKAALAQLQNSRLQWQNVIRQNRIAINTVMNRNVSEPFAVDTQMHWQWPEVSLADSQLFKNRSDLKLLDMEMEVNRLEQKAELASLKPEFGIRYDHMMGWARQPWQFSLMGMVRVPITGRSGRMNRAKAESLNWQNEALLNRQRVIENEATGQLAALKAGLELKKQQMDLYEKEVIPALRRNYQTLQLAYEQNTEELFPLFDAWQSLNDARLQYFDLMNAAMQQQAEIQNILELH